MNQLARMLLLSLLPTLAVVPGARAGELPALPAWSVLEFEEQRFWATAYSRLEIPQPDAGQAYWEFTATSSVPGNSEEVSMHFEPASGDLIHRDRLSKGKKDQRLKSFDYEADYILRERRNPGKDGATAPDEWPVTSSKRVRYPEAADDVVVTNSYLLLLLAERLQAEGPGATMEVLVHTDLNFYRARMTAGNGVPVSADFSIDGGKDTRGTRDTTAVALKVTPEGELADKDDFSVLGLSGEIILLFDRESGLPLQVRGTAPRVGDMAINLKSATLRTPAP